MWRDVRQAPGLPNKLRYVLGRPGWRHDGHARFASPSLAATNVSSPRPASAASGGSAISCLTARPLSADLMSED